MTSSENAMFYENVVRFKEDHPEPVECKIKGTVPAWLKGNLYRNGTGKFSIGENQFDHLFDGMAVLHKFFIADGKILYQNRLIESQALAKNTNANRIIVSEFGTMAYPDPCKNIFQRYFSHYFSYGDKTDNTCVNVMAAGDALYALTETDHLNRIDFDTLKTLDRSKYSSFISVHGATAHPHLDTDGTLYNLGMNYGKEMCYSIFAIPPSKPGQANSLEGMNIIAQIPSRWRTCHSYHHSFAMSENYIIYIEQSLVSNVLKLATSPLRGQPFSTALEFYKDEKTLFHLVNKKTGEVEKRKFSCDAMFVFHQVNCYEDSGHIVLDVCAYEDASIIEQLYLKSMANNKENDIAQSLLKRFILPLESSKVTLPGTYATAIDTPDGYVHVVPETFDGAYFELPQINYSQYNTKKYRYAYGVEVKLADAMMVKVDWETRSILNFKDEDRILTEPIFVPSPEAKEEDDGVLLVPAISPRDDSPSRLYILNAKDLAEIATADIPPQIAVPFSFHGLFLQK